MKGNRSSSFSQKDIFLQDPLSLFPRPLRKLNKGLNIFMLSILALGAIAFAVILAAPGVIAGAIAFNLAALAIGMFSLAEAIAVGVLAASAAAVSLLSLIGSGTFLVSSISALIAIKSIVQGPESKINSLIKIIKDDSSPNLPKVKNFLNNLLWPLQWDSFYHSSLFDPRVIKAGIDKGNPGLLEFICKAKGQMDFDPEVIEYAIKSKNPEMKEIIFKHLSAQEKEIFSQLFKKEALDQPLKKETKEEALDQPHETAREDSNQNALSQKANEIVEPLSPPLSPEPTNPISNKNNQAHNNSATVNYLDEVNDLLIGDDQEAQIASRKQSTIIGANLGQKKPPSNVTPRNKPNSSSNKNLR
jgi:hypothetical protein